MNKYVLNFPEEWCYHNLVQAKRDLHRGEKTVVNKVLPM